MAGDWTHPAIDNPAVAIHDYADIAHQAHAAFTRRTQSYPDAIRLARLDPVTAKADCGAWQAIACDWRWIAFGLGASAGAETLQARIEALDTALARWFAMVDASTRAMSLDTNRQGALLCAMRWWAERERHGAHHIRHTMALNDAIRRDLSLPSRAELHAAEFGTQASTSGALNVENVARAA